MSRVLSLQTGTGGWLLTGAGLASVVRDGDELLAACRKAAREGTNDDADPTRPNHVVLEIDALDNGVLITCCGHQFLAADGDSAVAEPLWRAIATEPDTLIERAKTKILQGDPDDAFELTVGGRRIRATRKHIGMAVAGGRALLRLAELISVPGDPDDG